MSSNFRHQLLSLSLLAGIAVPWVAFAQVPISSVGSDSVEDRVTQLEYISSAYSQPLAQLQQQLSDSQSGIDSLRGQIQENQHQLNQVAGRQEWILLQIDDPSSGGAAVQSTNGDQSGATASTTPIADAGTANAGAPVRSGNANMDYSAAIVLVQDKSRQDDAMVVFRNFIKNYPDSTYLPNASCWLGQLNYNRGERDDTVYYFASVVRNHPKSSKAADAMFKVGVTMQNRGDTARAKAVYQQVVSKYPGTDGAKQVRKHLSAV